MKIFLSIFLIVSSINLSAGTMNNKINDFISTQQNEFNSIDKERKEILKSIKEFIVEDLNTNKKTSLMFICTHNSRRSHISQLWFETALDYYDIENVFAYSGGTEATAFNPNAVAAMERVGFEINKDVDGKNPLYNVSNGITTYKCKSKKFSDISIDDHNFAAIMVCSDADRNCPFVEGATDRFSLPFNDPRLFDDKPTKESEYDKTVNEISLEMLYLAHLIKNEISK